MSVWVIVAFWVGVGYGYWLNRKTPTAHEPTINANLVLSIDQLDSTIVTHWLDRRGLVWMPKGAVFDPERTVKK